MALTGARPIVKGLKERGSIFSNEKSRIEKYTLADELPSKLTKLTLLPKVKSAPTYQVRVLTRKDEKVVLDFLQQFFFRDEPMNKAEKLLDSPTSTCIELAEYSVSSLDDGVCIGTVDEDDNIVGVVINGVVTREEGQKYVDKSDECQHPKFKNILKVLAHLDKEARLWDYLPEGCDKVMEVRIASTHSDWRGKGLMRVLCEETERMARKVGAGALRMDTTSAFSAAVAERLGYKQIFAVKYEDIPYITTPEPPHHEARVYVKMI